MTLTIRKTGNLYQLRSAAKVEKTISERAQEYIANCGTVPANRMGRFQGYIKGANEQRKIDIDKACKVYCRFCIHQCTDYPHEDCQVLIELKEAMEE